MKNSLELKEMRSEFISSLEVMKITAENEERDLTQDENTEMDTILKKVDEMDVKIERAEKAEKALRTAAMVSGTKVEAKEDKDLGKFTFQEAMRQAYTGNLSGIVKEMDQEARHRAHYTGQTFRGLAIPASILTRTAVETTAVNSTQTMSFTDQLEANLVLASAGANFYSGIENMKFPVISGVNSYWQPESGGTASTPTGTASSLTLSPKKIISVVNVSNEALTQNSGIEAALQRNMAQNIASTIEAALLNTTDATNAPTSIFADAAAGSVAALDAGTAVDLETAVLEAGVQLEGARMAYLLDVNAYKAAKTADQVANVSALYDPADKRLNGYFAFVSGNVASSGGATKDHALFGDFSKVHIAQFGGLDVLFDPYTNGATGEPRMIVTSLVDGDAVQNGSAFASLIEA
jgi:HK97 family phage major capsid protein